MDTILLFSVVLYWNIIYLQINITVFFSIVLCSQVLMKSSLLPQVVDDTQGDSEDNGPEEWVSYWKPNITVNLVDDFTRYVF